MKRRNLSRVLLLCALAAALAAGGAATAAAEENGAPDPGQIARGAKAWAENCGRCHNIRSPKDQVDYEWRVSVTHMRVRANLPGDVARDITAFLKSSN